MANEDPTLPPSDGVPSIPNLKKREKERKKAGAYWGGGNGAGSAFEGATGGIGEAGGVARAAATAMEAAEAEGVEAGEGLLSRVLAAFNNAEGGFFSRLASAIAELLTTTAGKMLAAAAVAMVLGGAAIVAAMLHGGRAAEAPSPNLGGITDNIHVPKGDASALSFARNDAGINFGRSQAAGKAPAAGQAAPAGNSGKTQAPPPTNGLDNSDINATARSVSAPTMAHPFGQLSGSLGDAFGGHDVFKIGPQFGHPFQQLQGFGKPIAATGKASSVAARASHGASMYMGQRFGNRMNNALGRLQQMATLNSQISSPQTGTEAAAQTASDQFEGQQTTGGQAPESPTDTTGPTGGGGGGGGSPNAPVASTDGGAGSCTQNGMIEQADGTCAPAVCSNSSSSGDCNPGANVSPWQSELQQAISAIDMAKNMLIMASALYLLAEVMIAISQFWFATGCCAYVGVPFLVIAGVLMAVVAVIMSIVLTMEANSIGQMADQIKSMGNSDIANQLNGIKSDLLIGAWTAIIGGIGGFWMASNISSAENTLQSEGQQELNTVLNQNPNPSYNGGTGNSGPGQP